MATQPQPSTEPRRPLNRDRVLRAAVDLADEAGIESVTMRRLGDELGVEAMSLYNHVANKEDLLNGVVDVVVAEVNQAVAGLGEPASEDGWKAAMRNRILTARRVMLRHPWAPSVIETRTTMSPEILDYYDGVLAVFRAGGFSYDLCHHAMHALGSRALGFTQELFAPDDDDGEAQAAQAMLSQMADRLPHLTGMLMEVTHDDADETLGWCDDQTEFEFGLDLLLDGLDRLRRDG